MVRKKDRKMQMSHFFTCLYEMEGDSRSIDRLFSGNFRDKGGNEYGLPEMRESKDVTQKNLEGFPDVEDTARILEEMNVKEEDEITMCELFEQYTRRGRKEGLQRGLQALISTCRELGVSFDETTVKVKEKFFLGDEEVRKNMQLYW